LRVRKACFDPSQGMTSFTVHDVQGSRLTEDVVSLSDFQSLGAYRYPRRLTKKSIWDTIDATVESFVAQSAFDENTFAPPADSIERDWCASPVPISNGSRPRAAVTYALYVYYVLVGADGRAKKLSFVNDPTQFALPQARQGLESKRYPILACSGKPIEYEMVVITNAL